MCREINLGISREKNVGYLEDSGLLKISKEANDWHKERHIYGLDIERQEVLKSNKVLQLIKDNPHENIMRIEDFDNDWVWVEYIDGDLFDSRSQFIPRQLRENPSYFEKHANDLGNLHKVLQGIYNGVQHLHKIKITHTDITGFNVMVDKRGNAKIIDLLGAMPLTNKLKKLDDYLVLRIYESILAKPIMTIQEYRIWEKNFKKKLA